ncbi:uncharacterized protein V1510DRAFT_422179 [Dipodascopsis tothii]|uniref:uncharacterized protein n=1 Tax=Dipodascopsis tothii TaxID=44089 RepID=UPI0034CF8F74
MSASTPVILLTGGSRGLGAAMARKLLAEPIKAKVVLIARTEPGMKALQAEYPGQVEYVIGDVGKDEVNEAAVKLAVDKFGSLTGAIFNAAILDPIAPVAKADVSAWKNLFDINYFSLIAGLKAAIPYLRESKGKVVFISSGAAHHYFYGWGAYGASKAATDHLAATLAVEEADIVPFSLDPGVMDTDMQGFIRSHGEGMVSHEHDRFLKLKSEGGLSPPEDPGSVAVNLVLGCPKELAGKAIKFNDPALAAYRDYKA